MRNLAKISFAGIAVILISVSLICFGFFGNVLSSEKAGKNTYLQEAEYQSYTFAKQYRGTCLIPK